MLLARPLVLVTCCIALSSCTAEVPSRGASGVQLPETLFPSAAPGDAVPLTQAKQVANVGDTITFTCRVGGRKQAFVSDHAVMIVIDTSLAACSDNEGDACPTPWDYCCETKETLLQNTATVQIVDDIGKPIAASLESKLHPLDWLTIRGTVFKLDDSGLLIVNATQIHVDKRG